MNDIINYGSPMYFLTLIAPIISLLILWLILRRCSATFQKAFIFFFIVLNVLQHLLKSYVWYPIYHGNAPIIELTFCNICACSILLSPIAFLSKNKTLKEAIFYFGSIGGMFSLVTPFYFEGAHAFTIDYLRFFSCHVILFWTSMLPVMLGLFRPSVKRFWSLGISYILIETLVLADNVLVNYLTNGHDLKAAYNLFYNQNPLWVCHPPVADDALGRVMVLFHFDFMIYDPTKTYIPVLWSIIIVYIFLSLVAFIIGIIFFRKDEEKVSKKRIIINSSF